MTQRAFGLRGAVALLLLAVAGICAAGVSLTREAPRRTVEASAVRSFPHLAPAAPPPPSIYSQLREERERAVRVERFYQQSVEQVRARVK